MHREPLIDTSVERQLTIERWGSFDDVLTKRRASRLSQLGGHVAGGAAIVAAQDAGGSSRGQEGAATADVACPEVVDLADLLLGEEDDGAVLGIHGGNCEVS